MFCLEASSYKGYGAVIHLEFKFCSLILKQLQNGVAQNHGAGLRTNALLTPNEHCQINSNFLSGPKHIKNNGFY